MLRIAPQLPVSQQTDHKCTEQSGNQIDHGVREGNEVAFLPALHVCGHQSVAGKFIEFPDKFSQHRKRQAKQQDQPGLIRLVLFQVFCFPVQEENACPSQDHAEQEMDQSIITRELVIPVVDRSPDDALAGQ